MPVDKWVNRENECGKKASSNAFCSGSTYKYVWEVVAFRMFISFIEWAWMKCPFQLRVAYGSDGIAFWDIDKDGNTVPCLRHTSFTPFNNSDLTRFNPMYPNQWIRDEQSLGPMSAIRPNVWQTESWQTIKCNDTQRGIICFDDKFWISHYFNCIVEKGSLPKADFADWWWELWCVPVRIERMDYLEFLLNRAKCGNNVCYKQNMKDIPCKIQSCHFKVDGAENDATEIEYYVDKKGNVIKKKPKDMLSEVPTPKPCFEVCQVNEPPPCPPPEIVCKSYIEDLARCNVNLTACNLEIEKLRKIIEATQKEIEKYKSQAEYWEKAFDSKDEDYKQLNKQYGELVVKYNNLFQIRKKLEQDLKDCINASKECPIKLKNCQDQLADVNTKWESCKKFSAELKELLDKCTAEKSKQVQEIIKLKAQIKDQQAQIRDLNLKYAAKDKQYSDCLSAKTVVERQLADANLTVNLQKKKITSLEADVASLKTQCANYLALKSEEYLKSSAYIVQAACTKFGKMGYEPWYIIHNNIRDSIDRLTKITLNPANTWKAIRTLINHDGPMIPDTSESAYAKRVYYFFASFLAQAMWLTTLGAIKPEQVESAQFYFKETIKHVSDKGIQMYDLIDIGLDFQTVANSITINDFKNVTQSLQQAQKQAEAKAQSSERPSAQSQSPNQKDSQESQVPGVDDPQNGPTAGDASNTASDVEMDPPDPPSSQHSASNEG